MGNSAYRDSAGYESEPVFPLQRPVPISADRYSSEGRSVAPAANLNVQRQWPFDREPERESGIYEIDDDKPPIRPSSRSRSIAVRIFGALVIGAAFYVCGAVLTNPQAGKAVLGWVTMGHADQVVNVVERAGSALKALTSGG
jgi:hypothetical protein